MSRLSRQSRRAERLRRSELRAPASTAKPSGAFTNPWWWAGLLVAAGLLVFGNSLWGPFIYDDVLTIGRNPSIRRLWPVSDVLRGLVNTPTAGRPLVNLSFALNYAAGGLDVRGYHAVNVAVHLLGALLLFGIVRRTLAGECLRDRFGRAAEGLAAACALIWMAHPLQTEAVNYLTQRTESLMGFFFLLTLYAAVRSGETGAPAVWTGLSIAACAAGMACKETMAVAPLAVVLYDWSYRTGVFAQVARARWRLYAGLAATWIVLAALMWHGPRSGSVGFSTAVSTATYAANQCEMLVHYLRLVVWPHPLVLDYGPPQALSVAQVLPSAALLGALGSATLVALWVCPPLGFPAAWCFLILAPTSSVIPIATEVGAERRMYLPLAGLVVLVLSLGHLYLQRAARRGEGRAAPGRSRIGPALVAATVAALGLTSVSRNLEYRDPAGMWRAALSLRPSPRARNNLATELSRQGRYGESVVHYRQVLLDMPESAEVRYNLAQDLEFSGNVEEAITQYGEFLRLRPDPLVHNILGMLLARQGRSSEAVDHYREALRLDPGSADPLGNLGDLLLTQHRYQEAVDQYAAFLKLRPDAAGAHNNLGLALASLGSPEEAIAHYRRAIELNPGYADAHFNLGVALSVTGQLDAGRRQLGEAVRLNPEMRGAAASLLSELRGVADDGDSGATADGATGPLRPRQR